MHFIIEIDAKTLLDQLNLPIVDLPGTIGTRWITWIKLLDVDVRHVSDQKHLGPEGLSRHSLHHNDCANDNNAAINDQINYHLVINITVLTRYVPTQFFVAAYDFTTHSVYVAALEIDNLNAHDRHYRNII